MQNEINKIRGFTNKIVETKNGSVNYKKDFTDFIILDHIYQSAIQHKDADVFIIFTGDGHFSSAALFLKNTCKKEVGVYGIKSGFSNQLKQAASWWRELPSEHDELIPYCRMILASLYSLEEGAKRKILPSFWKTIEAVERTYGVEQDTLKVAMEYLLEKKYINQEMEQISFRKVKALVPDWKKIEADGIYTRGYTVKAPAFKSSIKKN